MTPESRLGRLSTHWEELCTPLTLELQPQTDVKKIIKYYTLCTKKLDVTHQLLVWFAVQCTMYSVVGVAVCVVHLAMHLNFLLLWKIMEHTEPA